MVSQLLSIGKMLYVRNADAAHEGDGGDVGGKGEEGVCACEEEWRGWRRSGGGG